MASPIFRGHLTILRRLGTGSQRPGADIGFTPGHAHGRTHVPETRRGRHRDRSALRVRRQDTRPGREIQPRRTLLATWALLATGLIAPVAGVLVADAHTYR